MMTRAVGGVFLSLTALMGLVACSTTASDRAADSPAAGSATPQPTAEPSPEPIAPARLAKSNLAPEAPTAVTLPGGVVVPIRPATTARDGQLAVPDNIDVAGWWQGGARVGDPYGSTLVAAHVDSAERGLGPFADLLTIDRGDRVVLDTAHLTQEFVVDSLRLVPQGPLTDEESLFAADGPNRLTMVTCAPPYDRARGGYQNLAVVTARPVSAPARAGPR